MMIGSPFNAFNEAFHARFTEAGVKSLLLNGDVDPETRGELTAAFNRKEYPVIVAGLKAMGAKRERGVACHGH